MTDTYPWPCDRRTAHGPHQRTGTVGVGGIPWKRHCPGVPAHPDTMIGRQTPPVAPSEVDALMDDLYTCHDPDCTATHVTLPLTSTTVFTEHPPTQETHP